MSNLIQAFGKSINGIDSPKKLAMGMAIGCMIGFLPKDNLMFVGLLVFLIMSGANLVTGALAGLVTSVFSGAIQPLAHSLGNQVLSLEFVVVPLAKFLQFPVAPWTRLDNTVVSGSLTIGILAFVPVYLASLIVFKKYRDSIQRMFIESRLVAWVIGYPTDEEE